MTALDERPAGLHAAFDPASLGELRAKRLNEDEQHAIGWHEGYEAGYDAAHREMAAWWAQLARTIRRDAERIRGPVLEPINRATGHHDGITWRDWFTPAELAAIDREDA